MAYKHGVMANQIPYATRASDNLNGRFVPVYIGTLPVHTVSGGADLVNVPILLSDFAQAVKTVGYSDDWATFTLCEAIYTHLALYGTGPICVINVFDPAAAENRSEQTTTVTAQNNVVVLAQMGNVDVDSVSVNDVDAEKYEVSYDYNFGTLTIKGLEDGVLSGEITVKYTTVDASKVTNDMIIGGDDGDGTVTGIYLVKRVYQDTRLIPNRIAVPGFSHVPTVRTAMLKMSAKVNNHFDAFIFTDIPLTQQVGDEPKDMLPSEVATWKIDNGYNADNEKTHWPMWAGNDGHNYHLSVLSIATLQLLESATDGIPYQTCSNNRIRIGGKLFYGVDRKLSLDEESVNSLLNSNGIVSAIFHGGDWVLWGAHTASYTQDNADRSNVSETNLAMMYYITNDFQVRRAQDIDKPMSKNRLDQIVAEEQALLDKLGPTGVGALLYGEARKIADSNAQSDMANGDFALEWLITQTPNTKSITGTCRYTEAGLATYFGEEE